MRNPAILCLVVLVSGCDQGSAPVSSSPDALAPDALAPDVAPPEPDAAPPEPDAAPPAPDAAALPPLEWTACPDRFRGECTTLRVPLNHDDPDGETIEVFLSHRPGSSKQLWLLQGGPGASAESFYNFYGFMDAVDPELDIYTLEHRGVGDSTRLGCSAEAAGTPEGFQISAGEWPACLDEVKAEWGERLSFFSTTQAAHDLALAIENTRRPGQETFVYGISYGSFWAHRYAVLHPEQSTGIVLDGPVQPGSTLEDYDTWFEPVGRAVFEDLCPTVPRCSTALGDDPWAFFERTYAALSEGRCRSLGLDLDTWRVVFAIFLMDHNLRDWLPALIVRLDRCAVTDQQAIATLFDNLFGGGGETLPRTSRVTQVHVLLSENWPRTPVDTARVDAARETAHFFQDALVGPFTLQDTWPRYDADPLADAYAPPEVPLLTMAGRFDPAAPPARVATGYRDRLTGPHQTYVEMPYGAHGVLTGSPVGDGQPPCPFQLFRAFLADPTQPLPVACVDQVLGPSFDATPETAMRYWGTEDLYE
ncbi:MAG: alpha/beta fold hydrolase [Bradymonadia bacterium]